MTNKLKCEFFNYSTQTWTDVTTDVQAIQISGLGFAQGIGQTSPRGNQIPGKAKMAFVMINRAQTYNPSINGLVWPRNRIRLGVTGASLGNCLRAYVIGSQDAATFFQQVTVGVAINDVFVLQWDARCIDPRYSTDNVYITTSAEQQVWQLQQYTNKWATYSISFTATQIATWVQANFQANNAPGTNASTIEYRNISLTKNGGANLLLNSTFTSGGLPSSANWSVNNVNPTTNWTLGDATFGVLGKTTRLSGTSLSTCTIAAVPDSWIIDAVMGKPEPSMHQLAGDFLAIVGAYNATILCENQNINQPPQINQRADQIIATLYNLFSPGAILGKLLDVGFSVFPYAFDGYTFNKTKVIDGLRDAAMSEGGRTWIDRDGTLRFGNRQRMLNAVTKPIKLSVTDGMAYLGHAAVDDSLIVNKAVLTITPRVIGASFVQLAQLTAPVPIPPTPAGQPGTSVTMTFIDPATSKTCGGANVYPPIYTINGGGIDYTLQTTLVYLASVQVLASNAIYTFVNNTNQTLYLTTLTVSGNTVTSYNQIQEIVSDSASMARYQEQSFERALPYGADAGFALTLAQYFINRFKDPFQEVDSLQIDNKSVLNGVDLLGLELLDIVQVSDVQLGVSSQLYAIVGFDYTFDRDAPDYLASMKIYLERMDDSTYWVLADATYGQLGNTTRLSI